MPFLLKLLRLSKFYKSEIIKIKFSTVSKSDKRSVDRQFESLKEQVAHTSGSEFSETWFNSLKANVIAAGFRVNNKNFSSVFLEACMATGNYQLGKLFFHGLNRKGNDELNLAVIGKYFKFSSVFDSLCSDDDKKELIDLYLMVMKKYRMIDAISSESIIQGLCITPEWKESLKLLESSKQFNEPTGKMYSAIVVAALINGCQDKALELLEEMVLKNHKIGHSIIENWFKSNSDSRESLIDLLTFLAKFSVPLPVTSANYFVALNLGSLTTILAGGICKNCGNRLSPNEISDDEFQLLKSEFLSPVLIGKDIFLKSKPSEIKAFSDFLDKTGKVDVVLDGLNIGYSAGTKGSKSSFSRMLKHVVNHYYYHSKRVMVLGRNHMKKWPPEHMSVLYKNNCPVFFTDDLSQDDPLILYAAMHSGKNTQFVSRDLMRGHKHLLRTLQIKHIFQKWQQKNQVILSHVELNGKVFLKNHVPHSVCTQNAGGIWHCPIDEPPEPGVPPHIHLAKLPWLCFSQNFDSKLKIK